MKRPRRVESDVADWERAWALGRLTDAHPDYTEIYFVRAARLREVWRLVHGEELDAAPGTVVNGALV